MKITDYPSVQNLSKNDIFLLDGSGGTSTITARDLLKALTGMFGSDEYYDFLDEIIEPAQRRMIFRGKNLGSVYTSEQKLQVGSGRFKGLFCGDYWDINGQFWRIVDFDYWYGTGDDKCIDHHIVVMPDSQLYSAVMNNSNITTGGYIGSEMYKTNLKNAKDLVKNAFGTEYILSHREYLTNVVTDGHASGGIWADSTTELPNEIMMYGSYQVTAVGNGSSVVTTNTISKAQLALMAIDPSFICPGRQSQWLRDVASTLRFSDVASGGASEGSNASDLRGVRPVTGIKGVL